MFEYTASARTRDAFRSAHQARGAQFMRGLARILHPRRASH
ncbi:hypothetical protein [Thalassovita taeanensis]|nr:hypothetical protein [Thalassovita taeanensis]